MTVPLVDMKAKYRARRMAAEGFTVLKQLDQHRWSGPPCLGRVADQPQFLSRELSSYVEARRGQY